MLGGVTVNFLVAFFIYIGTSYYYGDADISTSSIKDGYEVTNPVLTDLGIQTGDDIVTIDGQHYENYSELRKNLITAERITIEREGKQKTIQLPEDFLGKLSTGTNLTFFELRTPFVVGEVPDSSANANSGLRKGDVFLGMNNEPIRYFDQYGAALESVKGQEVSFQVNREGEEMDLNLNVDDNGKLGIYRGGSIVLFAELGYFEVVEKKYSFAESIGVGVRKFFNQIGSYWQQLEKIFTPSTGAYKGVGGFKAIFDIFPSSWSWQAFWGITAFLSIMLAILNLLPIPALDGGHVMFLLYEMFTGRKPTDKFLEYAQMIGFFLLLGLIIFANGNDIYKAVFK